MDKKDYTIRLGWVFDPETWTYTYLNGTWEGKPRNVRVVRCPYCGEEFKIEVCRNGND